ncbi:MAG: ABC transporter substrate-binding protein [Thermoplasmata archaeon]
MNQQACKVIAVLTVLFALLASLSLVDSGAGEQTREETVLRVGAQDDTKSRNFLAISDVWSRNVLFPIYSTVALFAPETEELLPYVLKGIDTDDDGIFEQTEYGEFQKQADSNLSLVTAYYDFNGVYFHDGVQATIDDLLFSYHLFALDPGVTSLEVLQDTSNQEGSNYSTTRWLWVYPVEDVWDPSILVGGNAELTFALRFELQADYNGFSEHTLGEMKIIPRHLWEGTGKICRDSENGTCLGWEEDIHDNFGLALDPVTGNGIPAADPDAFQFSKAETWLMEDDLVIGTGPFKFDIWDPGVYVRLTKYDDFYADALDRNGSKYMHQPHIDGIVFKIYKTAQAAVYALQAGEIDVISWSVPPEFISDLLRDPNIEVSMSMGHEFAYLAYHMRRSPFGYPGGDPSQGDVGLYLRKTIAHLIDRETIVSTLLQGLGLPGPQHIHPDNVTWYNESAPKYDYDLDAARQILDDHYTVEGFALGYGPSGYRNLPVIGDREVEILCPQADYDPIRASACNMIAYNMRNVGINAGWGQPSFVDFMEMVINRNFEMWVMEQTMPSDIIEFYYATFYSKGGGNLAGFQNETFDSLVEEAREEPDMSRRIRLAKQCSGILADALPHDVIYFRANVEPYRDDRFVNWTKGRSGSIFRESFWSLIGIHRPLPTRFGLSLSSVSAMKSGDRIPVVATVRDLSGVGMPEVRVEVCVSVLNTRISPGNLTLGSQRGLCVSGETDINGNLGVSYEAPITSNESVRVHFTATAEIPEMGEASGKSATIVYPGPEFLSIGIEMTDGDIVFAGDSIRMTIEVTDWQGLLVEGTAVTLDSSPEGLVFYPSSETILEHGIGTISVEVPLEILGEEDELSFGVTVTATAEGYGPFEALREITVLRTEPPPMLPDTASGWRWGLIGVLLGAIVFSALARLASSSSRRGRRKHRRK